MAFRDKQIKFGSSGANELFSDGFFNVTLAVGGSERGTNLPAPNTVTDMQLVYYMDFIIYRDGDKTIFPGNANDTFQTTPPQIDYFSEETKKNSASMIWRFQEDLRRRGKPVYQDGRCDRATSDVSSLSKSPYTILMYNFYYAHTINNLYQRKDWQDYLLADALLPEQVRWELLYSANPFSYM